MRGLLFLVSLTLTAREATAGPNLLPNAGFEQQANGWSLWRQNPDESSGGVVDEGVRQGNLCFKVSNRGDGGANLHSDPVPVSGNTDYTLSVYARTAGARGVRVALWARDANDRTLSYELPHAVAVPGDQPAWARFRTIVRTPPDCVALKAHLVCNGGTVWWDAVKLESGREATAFQNGPHLGPLTENMTNLLPNSGFEQGALAWQLWRAAGGNRREGMESGTGRSGTAALHVVNPRGGGANLHSDPIVCQPQAEYTISVFARVTGGQRVAIGVWALDGSHQTLTHAVDGVTPLPADVPQYTRFSKTFTTPPAARLLKAHLLCYGGEVWWEDCQIERGARASDYTAGPTVEVLPQRGGEQAVRYTKAIIHEARLRDVLAQTERLTGYAPDALRSAMQPALIAARRDVALVGERLGSGYLVPDYREVDYVALADQIERAQDKLATIWQDLDHDPKGLFESWRPRLEGNLDKRRLANEFFIFPCFTRDWIFEGRLDWGLLEPFGFRVVSGWWGVGCRREGGLDTERMDHIIQACAEHGYRCDICLDGAAGATGMLREPLGEAIFLHNAQGQWSPSGSCHNTINIWHPEVRRVAAEYLRKAAAYYAVQPAVISYELTNEPSLTIEERVHGYRHQFLGVGGYSPSARKAWHNWLAQRYRTVEALNSRWRTSYASFAAVAPPADLAAPTPRDDRTPVATGAIHDFQTFRAESHADWFELCVQAMHAGDPVKPIISQFHAIAVDRKEAALDLRRMAEDVPWDFLGTHDWPGDAPATLSLYAVSMNRQANRPHWEDEFIWSQWQRKGTPEPVMRAAAERNLWRQIAWGKRGISLFNYETEWAHDLPHNWNNSMLNIEADLEVPRYSTGVIPTIERKVNQFKDTLFPAQLYAPDVAILRPTAATLVTAPERSVRREAVFLADRLLERHFLPLMVPEEHLAAGHYDLNEVKVLVVPWAINLPDAVQACLRRWIRGGGIVLTCGPLGLFDEYGKPAGELLKEALGDLAWEYDAKKKDWGISAPENLAPTAKRLSLGEAVRSPFVGQLGQGRLYLWPEPFHTDKDATPLLKLLDDVIPVPYVQTDLPKIEIVPRAADSRSRLLFIVNLDPEASREGIVQVRGPVKSVAELSCEARPNVPVHYREGLTEIPLRLHAGGAVLLELIHERTEPRPDKDPGRKKLRNLIGPKAGPEQAWK